MHIDVKRLGRITRGPGHRITGRRHYSGSRTDRAGVRRQIAGWECVHVAIDDASRLAYAEVLADETAASAVGFLHRALAFYERHGIQVEAVMTGQRLTLCLGGSRADLPEPWPAPPAHPPAPASDQRQGLCLRVVAVAPAATRLPAPWRPD